MNKNSTSAVICIVAAVLASARTGVYACVAAFLAPRISLQKPVFRRVLVAFFNSPFAGESECMSIPVGGR